MNISERQWSSATLLAAFDDHLRDSRGLCVRSRELYIGYVEQFLQITTSDDAVDPGSFHASDIILFVGRAAKRYNGSRTVEHIASSLRSFFRFLRAAGLRTDRLDDAVPTIQRKTADLPRHLDSAQLSRLIASLPSWSTPRGMRDGAIVLCIARLGLRSNEVASLELDDIDWRDGTVGVRRRKTGHGAILPLPADVGEAVASYLQHARPPTTSRQVFVLVGRRVGAPISEAVIVNAVRQALRRADIDAPRRGANLLRHSLATGLLADGASLKQISDLMGHRSLATTTIYARVDVAALADVGLAWPGATS